MTAPPLTPAALAELERLHAEATGLAGLRVEEESDGYTVLLADSSMLAVATLHGLPPIARPRAALIVTLHAAAPGLVAAVRERDRMRATLETMGKRGCASWYGTDCIERGLPTNCIERGLPTNHTCARCLARRALGGT